MAPRCRCQLNLVLTSLLQRGETSQVRTNVFDDIQVDEFGMRNDCKSGIRFFQCSTRYPSE